MGVLMILTVCMSYDLMHNEWPFVDCNDCTLVKIISGINFLVAINSLTRSLTY